MTNLLISVYRALNKAGLLAAYLKTIGAYADGLWRAVRVYYSTGDLGGFVDTFNYWVTEQLNRAWREGARDVGVYPEDFEAEDYAEIDRIIQNELNFVLDFAQDIDDARKAGAGVDQFRGRTNTWANRYNDVVNQARLWFAGKLKMEWVMGPTEQHCATCSYLNGIVAFAREWKEAGIHPQQPPNGALSCGGWECKCMIIPTDKRRTRNALDKIRNAPKMAGHSAGSYFADGVSGLEIKECPKE